METTQARRPNERIESLTKTISAGCMPIRSRCLKWTRSPPHHEQNTSKAFESIVNSIGMERVYLLDRDDQEIQESMLEAISEYQDRYLTYHWREFNGRSTSIPYFSQCLFSGGEADNLQAGVCPQTTRSGDVILLLHCARVLYILRERNVRQQMGDGLQGKEIQWNFVGECWNMNIKA